MNSFVKLLLINVLLFLSLQTSSAQSALVQQENLNKIGENWHNGSVITFNNRYKGVNGSPLLHNDWLPGSITLTSDTVITDVYIKYDVEEDRLYRRVNHNNANLILNYKIKSFTVLGVGSEKTFIKMAIDKPDEETFVELLANGTLVLVSKPKCRIRKADSNSSYGTGQQYDEYIHYTELFLLDTKTNEIQPAKANKKFFLQHMEDKEEAMSNYFKTNKPFLKDEKEVKQLVNFYNAL
ncbi:hypothetical protein [Chondrinema litorale]|uniref:hypothetical protein n=1 Tax=Chondrinema litorale TaxID=2994555 RepID=UPI002542F7AB|nr:hypothetical protein [Chondrinema litorale]UZR95145.1 hypothetical protein OQ292_04855 [Chondrinema litorale]